MSTSISDSTGNGTTWIVGYDPVITTIGMYTLSAGPQIADIAGNLFDDNGNGTQGETSDVGRDLFVLQPDITPPSVVSVTPPGLVNHDVGSLRVVFSEPIRASTFTASDVQITGPAGPLNPAGFTITQISPTTFDISFPTQSAEGTYTYRIGPAITDLTGNPMANLILADDEHFDTRPSDWTYNGSSAWNAGGFLRLTDVGGFLTGSSFFGTPQSPAPFHVSFDFAMSNGGGISDGDGPGADGMTFVLAGIPNQGTSGGGMGYQGYPGTSFAVELDSYWYNGGDINGDHVGIDWNGNFQNVQAKVPQRFTDTGIWHADIEFDGTSRLDVTILSPGGVPTLLSTNLPASAIPSQYTFGFTAATGSAWENHDIDNFQVYLLPTNGDGVFTGTFSIDKTGPRIISATPPSAGVVYTQVSSIDVTFSEPIDPITFTADDVLLTGPLGEISVSAPSLISGNTYRLTFAPQTLEGTYTLSVGPNLTDLAGNRMDQNANGTGGEINDNFPSSFVIALPDLAATEATATSTALEGSTIPVSLTVTDVSSTNPAVTPWSDGIFLSTQSTIDASAIQLTTVQGPPHLPLAPNGNYTLQTSVTLPTGLPVGDYYLLFVVNADGGQPESDANLTNNLVAVPIQLLLPAGVSVSLDPTSTSGAPNFPDVTNVTQPVLDLHVNEGGTLTVSFDGNTANDQTLTVAAPGAYPITAPVLSEGVHTVTATLNAGVGGTAQNSIHFTIDTAGPHILSMNLTGTVRTSVSQVKITFNEPIDPSTFTTSAITLAGPNGPISVDAPQLVSGNTFRITFATQFTDGTYTLNISPSVTDRARNAMDQNQNGTGGEGNDFYTSSFTMSLPVGGPITLNIPTLGFVPTNQVNDWTFFGRAGQVITTLADPAAAVTISPPSLNLVQITLLDADGQVLGNVTSTGSGETALLSDILLPENGIYHVHVQTQAGNTGFYVLTVGDATVRQYPLTMNQTTTGKLEDRFSRDQWTFSVVADELVKFDLLNTSNPNIQFDLTGPGGYTAFSGITSGSDPIHLPLDGTYTLTVHTTGEAGAYAFRLNQLSVTELALNTPYQAALAGSGQSRLFSVHITAAGNPLEIKLTDTNEGDHNEIYVSREKLPTRDSYEMRFTGGAAANQTIILTAAPGTYYILVYNTLARSPGSYTIEADSAPFLLSDMSPKKIGNAGNTTLQLSGVFPLQTGHGGYILSTAPTVQFIANNGTVYPIDPLPLNPPPFGTVGTAGGVNRDGTMTVSAVVPGGVLPAGTYSVRVTDINGYSRTLTDALIVVQGGLGILKTNVIVPNPIGYHAAATIYVQYTNVGDAPMSAPLLVLTATQNGLPGALLTLDASKIVSGFWTSATPDGYGQSVQFLAGGAVPGVLQPGESRTVPVYYGGWLASQWDFSRPPINFSLGVLDDTNTQAIAWPSLKDGLRPASISQSTWKALFANLTTQLGSTWGEYVSHLDADAQYLASIGENVTDIGELFNFEIQRANGFSPLSSLAGSSDAHVAAPGLPLRFMRSFAPGIIARNRFGRFGWGWSDSWETSLKVDDDGSVNILGPGGAVRRFQPDSRGGYFTQTGDHGTLVKLPNAGGYTLTELGGQMTAYNSDGSLNYVQDNNGNRITAGYTAGLLTSLTHTSGQFLWLSYNNAGRVSALTDSAGRTTTYHYDATNEYLMSVVGFDGRTTSYTYDLGSDNPTAHALLAVTHSNGTHDFFSYDVQGRLVDAHRDGGSNDTTFSYREGRVSITDALGNTTHYFFDHRGLIVQIENPLKNTVHYTYDDNLNLVQTTDAAGQVYTNTYDGYGDLLSTTDPLGHTVSYVYQCDFDRLAAVTDGNGNTTNYGYDDKGNLTSTTYADGTVESVAYDPIGNILHSKDRMGQVTSYTHNAAGNVLTETFADGSQSIFTYDTHENLTSATDASGTTVLNYDDNDRLILITYPGGHYLGYGYDDVGRRTQMVDDTGFTVNYAYDDLGNLATLTDGSGGLIVHYTYNLAGQLIREDKGNETYTTYAYDAAGELLHLIHYAPDGTVNSRFDYTYNSLGRRITEVTVDGTWSYSYDAIGQLTHAVFVSINPDISNQDLAYFYDAAGNRTQTIINGVTTLYTTNNLNEYTQVGATTYGYDANGNMTSTTEAGETKSYAFNVRNQLVGVAEPTGSWAYQYDVFGNRTATTENGQTTRYLIDPSGLGNVVAAFNGEMTTHYTYGLGLVSQVDTSATASYYDFDAIGSTVGVSSMLGTYFNTYSYSPFGLENEKTERDHNPFQFIGRWGVVIDASGLSYMRARYFSTKTSQFISDDPLRILAGDSNIRRYCFNDPINSSDPTGLGHWGWRPLNSSYIPFLPGTPGEGDLNPAHIQYFFDGGGNVGFFDDSTLHNNEDITNYTLDGVYYDDAIMMEAMLNTPPGTYNLNPFKGSINDCQTWANRVIQEYNRLKRLQEPPQQPPNGPSDPTGDGGSSNSVNSFDPNIKTGPAGFGTSNFVNPTNPFLYRIDFENDPTATAPAQRVDITDQLDPSLDWSTFQWTGFGFGDKVIHVPANTQHYQTTLPMTYNGVTFRVVVTLNLDPHTGKVTATFQSLNAVNLLEDLAVCPGTLALGPVNPFADLPPDVTIGFLPPEDGTGRGMGFLTYTVQATPHLPTCTEIRNVANVTFDLGNTIATDQVSETDPTLGVDPNKQALVTIDAGPPTSRVADLPTVISTTEIPVTWSGTDDADGSGVAYYHIYVSVDDGPFIPWLIATTQSSATYAGQVDHTYGFYSVATDQVGNSEAPPTQAQATTYVNIAPVAVDDFFTVDEGNTLTVNVANGLLSNDTDTQGSNLIALKVSDPAHGILTLDVNGSLLYTPNANFHGTDSFTYKVNDGSLDSNLAKVTLTVNAVKIQTHLTLQAPDVVYGTPHATVIATVTADSGIPEGTVQLIINGDSVHPLTATLQSGQVRFDVVVKNAGVYHLDMTYMGSEIYASSSLADSLTVTKAALVVRPINTQKLYKQNNPAFQYTYTGLVNGDTSTVVTGLSFATTASQTSLPGIYSVIPTGANAQNYSITYLPGNLTIRALPIVAVGAEAGYSPTVALYNAYGWRYSLQPYGASFKGGVRVATGDVNNDGVSDLVVAPGVGGQSLVRVYSGLTGAILAQRDVYPGFLGGIYVSCGDALGLGKAQIVVGPGAGSALQVQLYQVGTNVLTLQRTFNPFPSFTHGLTVAAGDGVVAVGMAGSGGGVAVYDQTNLARVRTLQPFGSNWVGGVTVAGGGGFVAVGRNSGAGDIKIYQTNNLTYMTTIQTQSTAPQSGYVGGTRLAWTLNALGNYELLSGTGPGWPTLIQYWVTGTWKRSLSYPEFGSYLGGIWIA